jgi:hypothetical protein
MTGVNAAPRGVARATTATMRAAAAGASIRATCGQGSHSLPSRARDRRAGGQLSGAVICTPPQGRRSRRNSSRRPARVAVRSAMRALGHRV